MTWQDTEKLVAGNYVLLQGDGDTADVFLAGEPLPVTTSSFGQPRVRFCFPVIQDGDLKVLILGARTTRKAVAVQDKLTDKAVRITRHGTTGNTQTYYDLALIDPTAEMIAARDAVTDAQRHDLLAATLAGPNLTAYDDGILF